MMAQEEFLSRHGIRPENDFTAYHYAYGLYVLYMIDSMELAEDIGDGIYFDEIEASTIIQNLAQAQKTMWYYRKRIKEPSTEFDIAETIALKGCRIEEGKIVGSEKEAARIARMWISNYLEKGGNLFSFEVGIYILFLLQEEIDYSFLGRKKG